MNISISSRIIAFFVVASLSAFAIGFENAWAEPRSGERTLDDQEAATLFGGWVPNRKCGKDDNCDDGDQCSISDLTNRLQCQESTTQKEAVQTAKGESCSVTDNFTCDDENTIEDCATYWKCDWDMLNMTCFKDAGNILVMTERAPTNCTATENPEGFGP